MPYCEGVEIAITEERVAPASAPSLAEAASAGPLSRDRPSAAPSLDVGGAAPLPPATAGPSGSSGSGGDEEGGSSGVRGFRERFRQTLWRNAESLSAAVTGEKLPQLPVQLRTYDSVAEAGRSLYDTASLNLQKMRIAAEFISLRTVDAVKLTVERLRNQEEETE